jgi:N4-gp56 family major capsid protein
MPGPLTTTTSLPSPENLYFDKRLLAVATPKLVHNRVLARRPLPQDSTKTIAWRRMTKLAVATAPLVEGHPPTGKTLAKTDISVAINQYGDFVLISDLERITLTHPVLRAANQMLGLQGGETLDVLDREELNAGGNALYPGGAGLRTDLLGVAHKIDTPTLDRAIRFLARTDAEYFTRAIKAGSLVATFPIRPAYIGICHPDILFTLEQLPGWKSLEEYSSQGGAMEGEVGSYKNLRILCSTQAKIWTDAGGVAVGDVKSTTGTNADVYSIVVVGTEAAATVPLSGQNLTNIIKPVGSAGTGDPLNQQGTSGWKYAGARKILNDNWLIRIECVAGNLNP